MTIHRTVNFALAYIDRDTGLDELADASEEMARSVDAALLAGPASLPGAQDLTQLAARVVTLENARAVLEARTTFTTATVPPVSGWSNPSASFPPLTVQKDGMGRVRLDGIRSNISAFTPSGTQVIGILPAGYRPALTRFFAIPVNTSNTMVHCDVRNDGQILAARGPAIPAGMLWTFDSVQFQAAP